MVRGYTTIEQSRKLAKILPLESADMSYQHFVPDLLPEGYCISLEKVKYETDIPCWSLATLLSVLPHIQEFYPTIAKINDKYVCRYAGSGISTNGNNPIDACVAMIEKLNELNLL